MIDCTEIQTFDVLSHKSSYTSNLIAEGISQALITTQFGLIIALPGIFGSMVLKKRLKIFNIQMNNLKYHLLFYFNKTGKNNEKN